MIRFVMCILVLTAPSSPAAASMVHSGYNVDQYRVPFDEVILNGLSSRHTVSVWAPIETRVWPHDMRERKRQVLRFFAQYDLGEYEHHHHEVASGQWWRAHRPWVSMNPLVPLGASVWRRPSPYEPPPSVVPLPSALPLFSSALFTSFILVRVRRKKEHLVP